MYILCIVFQTHFPFFRSFCLSEQKVICKGDLGILKDNTERSKWLVTGPGGLDMEVPSVCLIVPPPNPLSISLANKYETYMHQTCTCQKIPRSYNMWCMSVLVLNCRNEQYYEALQSLWNQLFINIKSLISWQYCLHDISRINSLTITMVTQYLRAHAHTYINLHNS